MTTYIFDGFSVQRNAAGTVTGLEASAYEMIFRNDAGSLRQDDLGVSSKGLIAAAIIGDVSGFQGPAEGVNVLEMMSGTMMGTNVLYDIPQFPGWAIDLMADNMGIGPVFRKMPVFDQGNLEMMSGMLTGTNVLFDIPDLPGASDMMSGTVTGTNVLFDFPDVPGNGISGQFTGAISAVNVIFEVPDYGTNSGALPGDIYALEVTVNIPGLTGEGGLQMMSGTVTGTNVLFDIPDAPGDSAWSGTFDLTGAQLRIPTSQGVLTGTLSGTDIAFNITDTSFGNAVVFDGLTGSSEWHYIPRRTGVIDDMFNLSLQMQEDNMDDLLNNAGAAFFDVRWNTAPGEKSAVVLSLTDPDSGAEHFYGISGDNLPEMGTFTQASNWLDQASFNRLGTAATAELKASSDWILFFDEADSLFGSRADVITGTQAGDVIKVGAGNDVVFSLGGDDRIFGGVGKDGIHSGDGDDIVKGGGGRDVLVGGFGNDIISGQKGADILDGGEDRDTIYGGKGNDVLSGGGGKDYLLGGRGKDILIGGAFSDTLEGGKGADMFVFDAHAANGFDGIRDFEIGVDKIHLVNALSIFDIEMRQLGRLVVVEFEQTSITLSNTRLEDLSMDDFVFTLSDTLI